ncbi:MAG: glycosyltransferase family 4 protein [Verrucomicrobia bacterium]|nr:glycosyltransferase family 4 protein [Verrucomicrobiota bacterium]
MKIALIRRQFSSTGGAELYLQRLLGALAAAGHELHLLTEAWPNAAPGVMIHPVAAGGSRAHRPRLFAEAVQREIATESFDCVFSLDRTLRQDVYRAGDGVHRVWLERRRQFAPWWRKPWIGAGAFHRTMLELERRTFDPTSTSRVIANSGMVKQEIVDHFRFPPDRIHVVRNGVDVARMRSGDRAAARARFGAKNGEFLLLFVGSGWERKGLPFLLRTMFLCQNASREWEARFQEGVEQALRDAESGKPALSAAGKHGPGGLETIKLLVIGKGKRPFRVPKNVSFARPVSEIEQAYAAADLFVFLPIYEPSANVVCEALAAGVPVVTSALNGASELIQQGVNGSVIQNPSDLGCVARAIGYWWSRRAKGFSIDSDQLSLERNVRETLEILEFSAKERLRLATTGGSASSI